MWGWINLQLFLVTNCELQGLVFHPEEPIDADLQECWLWHGPLGSFLGYWCTMQSFLEGFLKLQINLNFRLEEDTTWQALKKKKCQHRWLAPQECHSSHGAAVKHLRGCMQTSCKIYIAIWKVGVQNHVQANFEVPWRIGVYPSRLSHLQPVLEIEMTAGPLLSLWIEDKKRRSRRNHQLWLWHQKSGLGFLSWQRSQWLGKRCLTAELASFEWKYPRDQMKMLKDVHVFWSSFHSTTLQSCVHPNAIMFML